MLDNITSNEEYEIKLKIVAWLGGLMQLHQYFPINEAFYRICMSYKHLPEIKMSERRIMFEECIDYTIANKGCINGKHNGIMYQINTVYSPPIFSVLEIHDAVEKGI